MKLSEAILLGSIGTLQGTGNTTAYKESPTRCVIGAALFAIGRECSMHDDLYKPYILLLEIWPWLEEQGYSPKCLWLKNDEGWTRPQIAAWIATIEPWEDPIVTEAMPCTNVCSY